jgi:hypothetical protein
MTILINSQMSHLLSVSSSECQLVTRSLRGIKEERIQQKFSERESQMSRDVGIGISQNCLETRFDWSLRWTKLVSNKYSKKGRRQYVGWGSFRQDAVEKYAIFIAEFLCCIRPRYSSSPDGFNNYIRIGKRVQMDAISQVCRTYLNHIWTELTSC